MIRCDLGRDAFKNRLIAQEGFVPEEQHKTESLFCQGNGYLGLRASLEEPDDSGRGLFASGFYDEDKKLFNFADVCNLEFALNGKEISPSDKNIADFLRVFNVLDGELKQSFIYNGESCALKCVYSRFVSLKNEHLIASQLKLRVLKGKASVKVSSGIAMHETKPASTLVLDNEILQLNYNFKDKSRQAAISCGHRFYLNSDQISPDINITESQNGISAKAHFSLSEKDIFVVEKFSTLHTDRDLQYRDIKNFSASYDSLKSVREALGMRYNQHMTASRGVWKKYFEDNGILIDSEKDLDELALNFALYYMRIISHPYDSSQITGRFGLSEANGEDGFETALEALSPYYLFSRNIKSKPKDLIYLQYAELLKKRKLQPKSCADKCIAAYREGKTCRAEQLLDSITQRVFDADHQIETAHIANIWSCFAEGIAGISLVNDKLNIAPVKQGRVNLLQVPVWINKSQVLIRLEKDEFFVIVSGKESLSLYIYGESSELPPGIHRFSCKERL